jgi:hypothetical protein
MQHLLSYANLYLSHSSVICPSYSIYDSISLSALVTYLPPCYHKDLLFTTDFPPNTCILYRYIPELTLIRLNKVNNYLQRL